MKHLSRISIAGMLLYLAGCNSSSDSQALSATPPPPQSTAKDRSRPRDRNAPRGEAGDFDFYVLSLSWSPQHCSTPAGERDRNQCGGQRQYNFVVHGLWPQYDPKGWPQSCGGSPEVSDSLARDMMPLMPSRSLINHEWERHGTCSGLDQEAYFAKVKQARAGIRIPSDYESPRDAVRTSAEEIKNKFLAANPGMTRDSLGIVCSGRFLQEADVCLTRDLKSRACGAGVRDNCPDELIIQPIR